MWSEDLRNRNSFPQVSNLQSVVSASAYYNERVFLHKLYCKHSVGVTRRLCSSVSEFGVYLSGLFVIDFDNSVLASGGKQRTIRIVVDTQQLVVVVFQSV